jgi:hypothetical protein
MGLTFVEHRYQTCRDPDCQRYACRVYREGFEAGRAIAEAIASAQASAGGGK